MADIMIETNTNLDSINYRVVKNAALSKAAGRAIYTGIVDVKETYNTLDVARRMTTEGCLAKASTIRMVLSDFAELLGKLTAEGRAVNINGLVRFTPSIRGTFASADAPWNPAENALVVNATVGQRMRVAAADSTVNRTDRAVTLPTLERIIDLATTRSGVISSEGAFFVMGTKLTWDDSQADEGFFLRYGLQESKCIAIESVQDPTCAALRTNTVFEESGETLELAFRTRIGGALHQVVWAQPLVTA